MDRLIYTGLSAMRSSMARQTATAHNLANAQTPGFRADIAEASSVWLDRDGVATRVLASEEIKGSNMEAGPIQATGRDLDVAVNGSAMLAVQAANGEEAYTRRGDLTVNGSGLLTTGDGHPVLGEQGPIVVPPYDAISIAADGYLSIVPRGGDPAQPQQIDRLRLSATDGQTIVKALDGLFRVKDGGILPDDPDARVSTGHLEASNVSATMTLVEMVEASRSWDSQLKLLMSAREMDASTADLMRLPD